jgi:hypothetical protein
MAKQTPSKTERADPLDRPSLLLSAAKYARHQNFFISRNFLRSRRWASFSLRFRLTLGFS